MHRSALILAAHGSREEPGVNHCIRHHSVEFAKRGLFDVVAAAFIQGDPSLAVVLDRLDADDVTVVPFMASAGYSNDIVLPRELAMNERFSHINIRVTAPVGTHPRIASIVGQRVRELIRSYSLDANATTLALIGHGTERHERSRTATTGLAEELSESGVAAEVLVAFLDEEPRVETVCERALNSTIVVIPFLIGAGPHAMRDIPMRLGISLELDDTPPLSAKVGARLVVCDAAVGTFSGIDEVIEALAKEIR